MGSVRMGPPANLVRWLRDRFGLSHFVETGTYRGDTACWASANFDRVTTIEQAAQLHKAVTARHGMLTNIDFVHGDSREVVEAMLPTMHLAVIFWLDAHWSGGDTYGESDECPLLSELSVICAAPVSHFVLIDDARLFLNAPPAPHQSDQWPTIAQIVDVFQSSQHDYFVAEMEDVIIAVPGFAAECVEKFLGDRAVPCHIIEHSSPCADGRMVRD